MRRSIFAGLAFAAACAGNSQDVPPTLDANVGGLPDAKPAEPDATPANLHGTPPAEPKPLLAAFNALNRDGAPRGPADLAGKPTVIWFYPAALTGG